MKISMIIAAAALVLSGQAFAALDGAKKIK